MRRGLAFAVVALLAASCVGGPSATTTTSPPFTGDPRLPACVPADPSRPLPAGFPADVPLYPGSVVIRVDEQSSPPSVFAMVGRSFKDVLVYYRQELDKVGYALINDEVDPADGELVMRTGALTVAFQVKATTCATETSLFQIQYSAKG